MQNNLWHHVAFVAGGKPTMIHKAGAAKRRAVGKVADNKKGENRGIPVFS